MASNNDCKMNVSSMSEANDAAERSENDVNANENEGMAPSPAAQDEHPLIPPQLNSEALQSMTRSWWGTEEEMEDGESGSFEGAPVTNDGIAPPTHTDGVADTTASCESHSLEQVSQLPINTGDQDDSLSSSFASMPPPQSDTDAEKDGHRAVSSRQTVPVPGSVDLLEIPDNHGISETAPGPPRVKIPLELEQQPGAMAVPGREPDQLSAWRAVMHPTHRAANPRGSRRVLSDFNLSFHRNNMSHVLTAEIAVANAIDNAETVVCATFVNADESAKHRRIAIGLGILAIVLIVALATELTIESVGIPVPNDACLWLSNGDHDVFAHCNCTETTEGLTLTEKEQAYYQKLQTLLLRNNIIDGMQKRNSCLPQNQCMIWAANYRRRNTSDDVADLALNGTNPAIELYIMCLTYFQFHGWNWKIRDNWMETDVVCDWFGVSCSFLLSRVTGIDLESNGLVGAFPSELFLMPFLRELDLSDNNINGTIPRELSQARFLHVLDLSHTNVSGTVPIELGQLDLLNRLVLSHTLLSGTIPVNISDLSRMRELYLDGNSFSGTLYTEIGKLTRLAELSFAHNHFTGTLPTEFGDLRNLEIFRVNGNKLNGPIPSEYEAKEEYEGKSRTGWKFLEEINLSNNSFVGPFPSFLGDFQYLLSTFVFDTQLTGFIPDTFCNGNIEDIAIIILDCVNKTLVPKRNCTCCGELTYCIEKLPPSLQGLLDSVRQ